MNMYIQPSNRCWIGKWLELEDSNEVHTALVQQYGSPVHKVSDTPVLFFQCSFQNSAEMHVSEPSEEEDFWWCVLCI